MKKFPLVIFFVAILATPSFLFSDESTYQKIKTKIFEMMGQKEKEAFQFQESTKIRMKEFETRMQQEMERIFNEVDIETDAFIEQMRQMHQNLHKPMLQKASQMRQEMESQMNREMPPEERQKLQEKIAQQRAELDRQMEREGLGIKIKMMKEGQNFRKEMEKKKNYQQERFEAIGQNFENDILKEGNQFENQMQKEIGDFEQKLRAASPNLTPQEQNGLKAIHEQKMREAKHYKKLMRKKKDATKAQIREKAKQFEQKITAKFENLQKEFEQSKFKSE